jgi:hypothetical protein
MLWLAALQVFTVPPLHIPAALAGPQPAQNSPTVSWFAVQVSGQVSFVVRQPPVASLQDDSQHSLPAPTPQVVVDAEHEQELHTSPVPLQVRVQVPG